MIRLRLYVTGNTPRSACLVDDLRQQLDRHFADGYELEVRDIFDHPEEAYEDAVIATPTLMKLLPPPVVRLIGNLRDSERILVGLALDQGPD